MSKVEDFREKLPPEVEDRVDRAVQSFRENHKDPKNLALHAVGYYAVLRGVVRFLRHKRFRGLFMIAAGIALVLAGHELEGTQPFTTLRSLSNGRAG